MNSLRAPDVLLLDTNVVVLGWRHRIGDDAVDLLGALRRLARDGQQQLALDYMHMIKERLGVTAAAEIRRALPGWNTRPGPPTAVGFSGGTDGTAIGVASF